MSAEQAPGGIRSVREVLDLALAQAREADRGDLVLRLTAARRLLTRRTLKVQVTGASGQGKSALIEALMLAPTSEIVSYEEVSSTSDGAGTTPAQDVELPHVVLYVASAGTPLAASDVERLRALQDGCPNVIVVLTKLDQNQGWRDVLATNRGLLTDAGIGVEMFAVSAVWRMQAEWSGNGEHTGQSGVPALKARLAGFSADVERPAVQAAVQHTLAALAQLEGMLRRRRATLSGVEGPERAREQVNRLERRGDALRISSARCPVVISSNTAAVQGDVALDLRQRMQSAGTELDRALQVSSPVSQWPQLTGWLYELLCFEARLNREYAIESGARASAATAHQLGIAHPHQVTGTYTAAPLPLPLPPDTDTALPKVSPVNLTVVFGILMRVWVGFAIFFTLVAAAKLNVAPVVSLLPMLLMAGLGILEERRRWRERRRGHASAALRAYIADVSARVSKDSADLVRGLESELREAYGHRLEREREALATEHNRAQQDLRAIERSPRLLGEIDNRLRDYAELRQRATGIMPARLLAG